MFTIIQHMMNRYMGQKGQGMVEYALILAFVVALAIALTNTGGLREAIEGVFADAAQQVNAR